MLKCSIEQASFLITCSRERHLARHRVPIMTSSSTSLLSKATPQPFVSSRAKHTTAVSSDVIVIVLRHIRHPWWHVINACLTANTSLKGEKIISETWRQKNTLYTDVRYTSHSAAMNRSNECSYNFSAFARVQSSALIGARDDTALCRLIVRTESTRRYGFHFRSYKYLSVEKPF